ncbi:hypothetical protein DES41_103525 [Pseudorhodoferax soli]|uniref:Uncharacterized protein n=1 Tax=Pseudorhodoferax soli TaxID=545864 RepID=A0A368Y284_9BURK|nr:hypothetical protein DES41_103525 [Pseudorhodoferax soli]
MSAHGEGPRSAGIDVSAYGAGHRPPRAVDKRDSQEVAP